MTDQDFNFDAEFALLDIGATSSMLRTGSIRPTVLTFTSEAGVDAVALDWDNADGAERAFEEARRCARDAEPVAYALIVHISRAGKTIVHHLPGAQPAPGSDFLAISMVASDGRSRGVTYPLRRVGSQVSYGMPAVTDAETTDWNPLGDIWSNPYCVGDVVRFHPRDRAVDPTTPLWQAIVEITRLRIHEDQPGSEEYMTFLDDLRNGVFVVSGRPETDTGRVLLRPRTNFNPLGTLNVEASRLMLDRRSPSDKSKAAAP